jgi:hypothetical protein
VISRTFCGRFRQELSRAAMRAIFDPARAGLPPARAGRAHAPQRGGGAPARAAPKEDEAKPPGPLSRFPFRWRRATTDAEGQPDGDGALGPVAPPVPKGLPLAGRLLQGRLLPWGGGAAEPAPAAEVYGAAAPAAPPPPSFIDRVLPWGRRAEAAAASASARAGRAAAPQPDDGRPVLGLAGGGVYFFWELGVLRYLSERYDLGRCRFVGASAGALAAVLCACRIDPLRATRLAFDLSIEADVLNRPGGLAGIWGALIRRWLDELLPEDAAERCRGGRVRIVATEVPALRVVYLDDFASRQELIDALMASVHIPLFLDGAPSARFRGAAFVDGSLWDFVTGANSDLITLGGAACVVDYFFDEELSFSRLDFVKFASYEWVVGLVDAGEAYAARTDAVGGFDAWLAPARKPALQRALELPVRALTRRPAREALAAPGA